MGGFPPLFDASTQSASEKRAKIFLRLALAHKFMNLSHTKSQKVRLRFLSLSPLLIALS